MTIPPESRGSDAGTGVKAALTRAQMLDEHGFYTPVHNAVDTRRLALSCAHAYASHAQALMLSASSAQALRDASRFALRSSRLRLGN